MRLSLHQSSLAGMSGLVPTLVSWWFVSGCPWPAAVLMIAVLMSPVFMIAVFMSPVFMIVVFMIIDGSNLQSGMRFGSEPGSLARSRLE